MKIKDFPKIEYAIDQPVELIYFTLQNYKQFKTRTKVEFRKITLLVGPNGAGKSNLIDAYELFYDTSLALFKGKKFTSEIPFENFISDTSSKNTEVYLRLDFKKENLYCFAQYSYTEVNKKTHISKAEIGYIDENGVENFLIKINFNKEIFIDTHIYSDIFKIINEQLKKWGLYTRGIVIIPETLLFETTSQYEDQLINFFVSFYFFKNKGIEIIPYAHLFGLDKLDDLTKEKIEEVKSKSKEYYDNINNILQYLKDFGHIGGIIEDENRELYFSIEDVRPKPPEYFEVERGVVLNDYYNIVNILKNPLSYEWEDWQKLDFVPNELDTLKKLLSYFEIADDIFLKEVGHLDDKIFYKVYLRKKDNFFTLDKLSSGSIQLLPFLLQFSTFSVAVSYLPGVLYLRQPELHLHPKIQMEITELIVTYGSGMNWCIETHSEHIIRKFQLLVSKNENLKNEDVIVNYISFDPETSSSYVKQLRLDEKGNFIDEWPGGFFDEASELAYALLEAQVKRKN